MQPDQRGAAPRRLRVYNGGLLTGRRVRRILELAGWQVRTGLPRAGDRIGVWGASPTAPRGGFIAARTGAPVVRVEDAFLRSLFPGRSGEPTLGLLIDEAGVHFDPSAPSDLETLLASDPLDTPDLLARARGARSFMVRRSLSKFAATDPGCPAPGPGHIVVIDQSAEAPLDLGWGWVEVP